MLLMRWRVVALLLLAVLLPAGIRQGAAQTSPDVGFPVDVTVQLLGEGLAQSLPELPAEIRVERVALDGEAHLARTAAGPQLLVVESGDAAIVDELGIQADLPAGRAVALAAGTRYEARAGGSGPASLLIVTVVPVGGGESDAGSARAATIFSSELEAMPASPAWLVLARVNWPPGAPPSDVRFAGPAGLIGEAGTLTVGAPGGQTLDVGAGSAVLVNAGAVIAPSNAGEAPTTVLLAAVVPEGMPLVAPVAVEPTPLPTVTSAPLPTAIPTSAPEPTSTPFTIDIPLPTPVPLPTAVPTPVASALGGVIVYGARVNGQWDLYAYDGARGQARMLTGWAESDEWAPMFSHAGRRLAYLSDRTGTTQVWMLDPLDGEPFQVTNHPGPEEITYVAWSGDDQRLLLTVRDPVRQSRVMSVPAGGGALGEYWPPWSGYATQAANGRWAFVTWAGSETDIYGVSPDGTQYPLAITQEDEDVPNIDASGASIAYNAGTKGARRIQIIPAVGGEPVVLPQIGADDSNPVWSPDGSALAIVTTTNEWDDIWIVPLSGGEPVLLDLPGRERLWYLTWAA